MSFLANMLRRLSGSRQFEGAERKSSSAPFTLETDSLSHRYTIDCSYPIATFKSTKFPVMDGMDGRPIYLELDNVDQFKPGMGTFLKAFPDDIDPDLLHVKFRFNTERVKSALNIINGSGSFRDVRFYLLLENLYSAVCCVLSNGSNALLNAKSYSFDVLPTYKSLINILSDPEGFCFSELFIGEIWEYAGFQATSNDLNDLKDAMIRFGASLSNAWEVSISSQLIIDRHAIREHFAARSFFDGLLEKKNPQSLRKIKVLDAESMGVDRFFVESSGFACLKILEATTLGSTAASSEFLHSVVSLFLINSDEADYERIVAALKHENSKLRLVSLFTDSTRYGEIPQKAQDEISAAMQCSLSGQIFSVRGNVVYAR